ncbi:MAG: LPS export ABC transporter permease LptG [Desulfobacterales bacterium]|jgi:lipopolysaccharide export system permease protein|nr:LPS export ABC transporter permease LptG [Desulfobacterales bacterium]
MNDKLRIIDRHLGRTTFQGFFLVISLLVVLFSVFELLLQLDYVGKGAFLIGDAFGYVALTMPKRFADLTPMAVLLGSVGGLGMLSDHEELTAMQVAGVSAQRICRTVLATSTLLMLAALGVSEFIAPPLDQYARTRRFQSIYGNDIMLTKHGFWARQGSMFIYVDKTLDGGKANDIEVYEFDEQGALRKFVQARNGRIQAGKEWVLTDAKVTAFNEGHVDQRTPDEYRIADFLSLGQAAVLELPADSLSISDLYAYIQILARKGQNANRYELAFWQKIYLPLTTAAMALLSLTFVFGSTRLQNAWQRIFTAMLVGTLIYLMNQIFGQLSLVLLLPPTLMALLPSAIILAVALRLLRHAF